MAKGRPSAAQKRNTEQGIDTGVPSQLLSSPTSDRSSPMPELTPSIRGSSLGPLPQPKVPLPTTNKRKAAVASSSGLPLQQGKKARNGKGIKGSTNPKVVVSTDPEDVWFESKEKGEGEVPRNWRFDVGTYQKDGEEVETNAETIIAEYLADMGHWKSIRAASKVEKDVIARQIRRLLYDRGTRGWERGLSAIWPKIKSIKASYEQALAVEEETGEGLTAAHEAKGIKTIKDLQLSICPYFDLLKESIGKCSSSKGIPGGYDSGRIVKQDALQTINDILGQAQTDGDDRMMDDDDGNEEEPDALDFNQPGPSNHKHQIGPALLDLDPADKDDDGDESGASPAPFFGTAPRQRKGSPLKQELFLPNPPNKNTSHRKKKAEEDDLDVAMRETLASLREGGGGSSYDTFLMGMKEEKVEERKLREAELGLARGRLDEDKKTQKAQRIAIKMKAIADLAKTMEISFAEAKKAYEEMEAGEED